MCYSIGYYREDGDFAILATLNNNDALLGEKLFEKMKESILYNLQGYYEEELEAIERQDCVDYVTIEEE